MTASQLDDLGQQTRPHANRRPVDEGDVAGLHRIEVGRERLAVSPCIITDAAAVRRSRREPSPRDVAGMAIRLRITAGRVNPGDALTGFDIFDTHLPPQGHGPFPRRPEPRVGNVDPCVPRRAHRYP